MYTFVGNFTKLSVYSHVFLELSVTAGHYMGGRSTQAPHNYRNLPLRREGRGVELHPGKRTELWQKWILAVVFKPMSSFELLYLLHITDNITISSLFTRDKVKLEIRFVEQNY
jgi:hypothetical protein